MKVILRVVAIDGQETHDIIQEGGAAIPDVEDHITFEVRPGEWVTRLVTARYRFRYGRDEVTVELEAPPGG